MTPSTTHPHNSIVRTMLLIPLIAASGQAAFILSRRRVDADPRSATRSRPRLPASSPSRTRPRQEGHRPRPGPTTYPRDQVIGHTGTNGWAEDDPSVGRMGAVSHGIGEKLFLHKNDEVVVIAG